MRIVRDVSLHDAEPGTKIWRCVRLLGIENADGRKPNPLVCILL